MARIMPTDRGGRPVLERVPTGIPGLDTILRGGLLRGGIFIVQGSPGAGKTIVGNQICFNQVAKSGHALYVSLLAEHHARMLLHIGQLGFFEEAVIPDSLYYISAFRVLEQEGLSAVLDLLRREVQVRSASVLVLDGFSAIEESAGSGREFKKFIHELQAYAAMADCTMLLLTGVGQSSAEHTLVDGVIELQTKLYGRRAERVLQVHKLRGGGYLRGEHSFCITDAGIIVYPRTEALLAHPSVADRVSGPPVSMGVAQLDRIMGGGFPQHSTALLTGPPGIGKTTLGLHFLSRCDPNSLGVFFGFYETPASICDKAQSFGLPFKSLLDQGYVEIIWQPTTEGLLDEACNRLIAAVSRRGVRRLFIDGVQGFDRLAPEPERLGHIFSAFSSEFRGRGISTLYTAEADLIGPVLGLPFSGLALQGVSCIAEIILVMRYVELRAELHRMVSVLKVRDAEINSALHRFTIAANGLDIDPDPAAADEILAQATRQGRNQAPGENSSCRE
ncbi:MAG: serine/threonine protein phosphatase [Alphaproteobacteria bacterium]|nr:serine/threonine protein phosphatase [Alphaproteobacteria bacterium]